MIISVNKINYVDVTEIVNYSRKIKITLNIIIHSVKFPFVYIIVLTEVYYQSAVQSDLKLDDWLIAEREAGNSIPINKYLMNYSLN